MFWPTELSTKEAEISIIPELLRTQDQFLAILKVDVETLDDLFQVIDAATLPANMFLKHLVVLADFGGEMLDDIKSEFSYLFPDRTLRYIWKGKLHSYQFKSFPLKGRSNDKLGLSGKKLLENRPLSDPLKDAIALLIFGSACANEDVARTLAKCELGNYLGEPDELERFIKQRYIWVSRITGGSKANDLGQIAQQFVRLYIADNIGIDDITVTSDGKLPGVTYSDEPGKLVTFDIVVSNGRRYVGIEVSFQVTTNSTIEQKARRARDRYERAHGAGHKVANVIDGAGNFRRENAISTLCQYSDCTVAFTSGELEVLCQFIRGYLTMGQLD